MKLARVYIVLMVWLCSCSETIIVPENEVPQISFKSLIPEIVTQFKDSLALTIGYKDGNGDLGDFEADSLSLFLKDSRIGSWDRYHIPPLAPLNSEISIQGSFRLKLKNVFLLTNAQSENLFYEIYVKDRKGNKSNVAISSSITIKR